MTHQYAHPSEFYRDAAVEIGLEYDDVAGQRFTPARLTADTEPPFTFEDAVDVAAEGQAIEAAGVPYLVDGIIPAFGMLGFLVAYAKVGKTTFGQALAAHLADGVAFLEHAQRSQRNP